MASGPAWGQEQQRIHVSALKYLRARNGLLLLFLLLLLPGTATTAATENTQWSRKKTGHYIIGDNFVRCGPIFATFALLQRKLNFQ